MQPTKGPSRCSIQGHFYLFGGSRFESGASMTDQFSVFRSTCDSLDVSMDSLLVFGVFQETPNVCISEVLQYALRV